MKTLLSTEIGRLRIASMLDGISYIILLGFSVLKRVWDMPGVIRIPGMIHGGLFVALCLAILLALTARKLPVLWAVVTFFCALLPLAPFFLDRKLRTFQANPD
ncbi:MAG: DUF3817 domain-containing protein [Verrucomicrobiales bacterium]|nr:DUF3817 domain-containing protein [Verrucomicrobiales bacterium]